MEIKTKFEITDLVTLKTERRDNSRLHAMVIMEIVSQTCYSGTQLFYLCRVLTGEKVHEISYDKKSPFVWIIGHIQGSNVNDGGYKKYREDELIESSKEVKSIIEGDQK